MFAEISDKLGNTSIINIDQIERIAAKSERTRLSVELVMASGSRYVDCSRSLVEWMRVLRTRDALIEL